MARYEPLNNHNARDTVTGDWLDVIERSVWYVHARKTILAVMYNGTELHFMLSTHLADVQLNDDEFSRPRKLVLKYGELESGHRYPIIVAVQPAFDAPDYVDCIVADES